MGKKTKKLKRLAGYYSAMHFQRVAWYSWKWRLIVVLLAAICISFVYDLLQTKYFHVVVMGAQSFVLADKLFSWFMTGVLFGIIALAILYEGEVMLGLRRAIREIEGEVDATVKRLTGASLKPAKTAGKRKTRKK